MRLIDADVLKECILEKGEILIDENVEKCESMHDVLVYLLEKVQDEVIRQIDECPTATEIVECRNCKFGEVDWPWSSPCDEVNYCRMFARETMPECYCNWGIEKDVSD
jgi:hypothetical protein